MAVIVAPKHKNLFISAHILLLAAIMDSILDDNVPIILSLRYIDMLTLNIKFDASFFILAKLIAEICIFRFCGYFGRHLV